MSHNFQDQRFKPPNTNNNQSIMMFSMQRIGRSAKTPMTTAVNQALARQAKSAFGTAALNLSSTRAQQADRQRFPDPDSFSLAPGA